MPRQHAADVAVEDRASHAERERGDRRSGRTADTGERRDRLRIARKVAAMPLHDRLRRRVQVMRAPVVAESAPVLEYPVEWRQRERANVGKGREELLVVRNDRRDLRLLQHDLGQPDPVGVARVLPRKVVAAVRPLPRDKARGKRS